MFQSSPSKQNNTILLIVILACLFLGIFFYWLYQSPPPSAPVKPTPVSTPATPASAFSFDVSSSSQLGQQLSSTGPIYTLIGTDATGNIADTTIQTDKKNVKINGEFEVVNASGTQLLHIREKDAWLDVSGITRSRNGFCTNSGFVTTIPTKNIHQFRGGHAILSVSSTTPNGVQVYYLGFVIWIPNLSAPMLIPIKNDTISCSIDPNTQWISIDGTWDKKAVWNILYLSTPDYLGNGAVS